MYADEHDPEMARASGAIPLGIEDFDFEGEVSTIDCRTDASPFLRRRLSEGLRCGHALTSFPPAPASVGVPSGKRGQGRVVPHSAHEGDMLGEVGEDRGIGVGTVSRNPKSAVWGPCSCYLKHFVGELGLLLKGGPPRLQDFFGRYKRKSSGSAHVRFE